MVAERPPERDVLQTSIRKSPLLVISVSFILFSHLHPSPPPPPSLPSTSPQKPVQSASLHWFMVHVQANCAAKRIISVHCRRPVNQSSLCYRHRAAPPHPTRIPSTPSPPQPTYSGPPGQGAIRISARRLSSGPSWPHRAGVPCG